MDKIPIKWLREYQKRYDDVYEGTSMVDIEGFGSAVKGSLMSMAIDIIIDDFEAEMEEENG